MSKVYGIITERILGELEKGTVPWRKPWAGADGSGPRNLVSGKPYRGVNVFMLGCAGFSDPWFLTFRQARKLGGCVRKGQRGMPVIFWSWRDKTVEDPDTGERERRRIPILRYYTVFHVSQADGIPPEKIPAIERRTVDPIESAETLAGRYIGDNGPDVSHGFDRACYAPALDAVRMPHRDAFDSAESYYSTLFHELGHSTGHETRCNRADITASGGFGSKNYAREELTAEMTAAFCLGLCGIENLDQTAQSAAYIDSWLGALRRDPKLVVLAAARAQRAADWIRGVRHDADTDTDTSSPAAPVAKPADPAPAADPDPAPAVAGGLF